MRLAGRLSLATLHCECAIHEVDVMSALSPRVPRPALLSICTVLLLFSSVQLLKAFGVLSSASAEEYPGQQVNNLLQGATAVFCACQLTLGVFTNDAKRWPRRRAGALWIGYWFCTVSWMICFWVGVARTR
jgi:hypothetical protein